MARTSFLQADIERVIRAARKEKAVVQFDLKTLVFTIFPNEKAPPERPTATYAQDGKENWDE